VLTGPDSPPRLLPPLLSFPRLERLIQTNSSRINRGARRASKASGCLDVLFYIN
jgi:hypothetical protein